MMIFRILILLYLNYHRLNYHRIALTVPRRFTSGMQQRFLTETLTRLVVHEHFQPIAESVNRDKLVAMFGPEIKFVADGRDMGVQ